MRKAIVHIIENESHRYHKLNVEFDEIDELIFSIDYYADDIEVWNLLVFVSCKELNEMEIFELEDVHIKISSDVYIPKNNFTKKEKSIIELSIRHAYETSGLGGACDLANVLNLDYQNCDGCTTDVPVIDGECLICGQETKIKVKK
jgi:hypothetical protein